MKKIILLISLIIIFSQFALASSLPPKLIPEEYKEYNRLFISINKLAREGGPNSYKINDCFSKMIMKVYEVTPMIDGERATTAGRITACINEYGAKPEYSDWEYSGLYDVCLKNVVVPAEKAHYARLIPIAKEAQRCIGVEEEVAGDLEVLVEASEKKIIANGTSTSKITVIVHKDWKAMPGEKLSFSIVDTYNLLKDVGKLSATSATTKSNGVAAVEYTAPLIEDADFRGSILTIQVTHATKKYTTKIKIESIPKEIILTEEEKAVIEKLESKKSVTSGEFVIYLKAIEKNNPKMNWQQIISKLHEESYPEDVDLDPTKMGIKLFKKGKEGEGYEKVDTIVTSNTYFFVQDVEGERINLAHSYAGIRAGLNRGAIKSWFMTNVNTGWGDSVQVWGAYLKGKFKKAKDYKSEDQVLGNKAGKWLQGYLNDNPNAKLSDAYAEYFKKSKK